MTVILGEIIRKAVRENSRSAKEICDILGMSRGNLDKIYKKDSINTDLLAKLSVTLNHDFFQYVNPFVMTERDGPRLYHANDFPGEPRTPINRLNKCIGDLHDAQKEIAHLEQELTALRAHLVDKERIISLQQDRLNDFHEQVAKLRGNV